MTVSLILKLILKSKLLYYFSQIDVGFIYDEPGKQCSLHELEVSENQENWEDQGIKNIFFLDCGGGRILSGNE